jgi:hypothetical protein
MSKWNEQRKRNVHTVRQASMKTRRSVSFTINTKDFCFWLSRFSLHKYLGSIVHHSLTSEEDVDKHIISALAAFGALKYILTNKDIDLKVKGSTYVALCLSILLYGSETWCLQEDLFNRLRHFHHWCARTMCRITIADTIRHRISSASLFKRLSIEPFDKYYNRRLLRWTGHIARMPFTRAPRKILTSSVDNPRPLGWPQMN